METSFVQVLFINFDSFVSIVNIKLFFNASPNVSSAEKTWMGR